MEQERNLVDEVMERQGNRIGNLTMQLDIANVRLDRLIAANERLQERVQELEAAVADDVPVQSDLE